MNTNANTRPDGITILAIWYLVLAGGFGLAACVAVIPVGILSLTDQLSAGGWSVASLLIGFGLSLTSALALACGVVAWGLWNLAEWARIGAFLLALLHLPFFPVGTAIGAATLWYLTSHPQALAAFGRR